jgi:DNA-directed RNA polymerase subunit RPC12/RpoP
MTLHFVRWPMVVEADVADQHLTCPHCADDWTSLDGPDRAIIGRTGPQRRCPACGSWIDWPEATNGV